MNDIIDPAMKKVFKHEVSALEKYKLIAEDLSLSEDELRKHYKKLLKDFRSLLQDAMKITNIGDINQKKLFEAFEALEKQKSILYQTSIMDHLTQVHNRPYIMKVFDDAFAQTKRYHQDFSCILLDIDNFKSVNDNYGHPMGDLVLKETAQCVASQLRKTDTVGRYGGEEFLIILPNTVAEEAEQVAEKIRTSVAESKIGAKRLKVTISLGICDTKIDFLKSQDEMLFKVDTALYVAKKNGKNRSVVYSEKQQQDENAVFE
jgi:diguanylate cyclase (GGDEF)-like protein